MDHCFPEYDIWTQFVSADYTRALDLDALDSSHPIEVTAPKDFHTYYRKLLPVNVSALVDMIDEIHSFDFIQFNFVDFHFVLQVNVGHPSEVDEIFDAISYSKGASVIRMLHNYIGDEVGRLTPAV